MFGREGKRYERIKSHIIDSVLPAVDPGGAVVRVVRVPASAELGSRCAPLSRLPTLLVGLHPMYTVHVYLNDGMCRVQREKEGEAIG